MDTFKLALVTGATSGIGEALAKLLASKGISLILTGRNENKLKELSTSLGVAVHCITADLAKKEERAKLIACIHELKPDLVVNNAGFAHFGEVCSLETPRLMEVTEVNAVALQELTLEALKSMKNAQQKGVILNVASVAAFIIIPSHAIYCATKAFVVQLSESLDFEMRPYGMRVLASCPGVVYTDFKNRSGGPGTKAHRRMSVEYAAEEIWRQIVHESGVVIFNWRARLRVFWNTIFSRAWLADRIRRNTARVLARRTKGSKLG